MLFLTLARIRWTKEVRKVLAIATVVTPAPGSALRGATPAQLHALQLEPTRCTNCPTSLTIPTTTAIAEVMPEQSLVSATRRATINTMNHPRGRKHHQLRHLFPFQTSHQRSASTLPKGLDVRHLTQHQVLVGCSRYLVHCTALLSNLG